MTAEHAVLESTAALWIADCLVIPEHGMDMVGDAEVEDAAYASVAVTDVVVPHATAVHFGTMAADTR